MRRGSTLLIALALQGVVLVVTVFVIVSEDAVPEAPDFAGTVTASAPQNAPELRERVRELQRRLAKPRSLQRLTVEPRFDDALPDLPALPQAALDFDSLEQSVMAEEQAGWAGSELGSLLDGLASGASQTSFFGVEDSGRRIVIVVNTSASVARKAAARGVSLEVLRQEAIALIDSLQPGTSFGLLQFSQGTKSFSETLSPALKGNKDLVRGWVEGELRGNPKVEGELVGHEAAFSLAFAWQPDLIFFVTDGSLNRRTPKAGGGYSYPKMSFDELLRFLDRLSYETGADPRLHFIGFELGETETEGLQRIARRFDGSLREL